MVHDAIIDGFLGVHPVIPVKILEDLFHFFAAIFGQDAGADFFYPFSLFRRDLQVDAYPLHVSPQSGLVDHDLGMREYEPATLDAPAEQDGAHGSGQSHTDGANGTFQHFHGIVDDHTGGYDAPGAVDKELDLFSGLVGVQEQQFIYYIFGRTVVYATP